MIYKLLGNDPSVIIIDKDPEEMMYFDRSGGNIYEPEDDKAYGVICVAVQSVRENGCLSKNLLFQIKRGILET